MGMLARLGVVLGLDSAEFQKNLSSAGNDLDRFVSKAKGLGATLIGSLSAAGIGIAFKNIVEGMNALNDAADATGASIDKLATLERIVGRTGGDLNLVTSSILKLNQQLATADEVTSKAAIVFKSLGLEVEQLKQLDPADMLTEVARAFDRFADDGEKARVAQLVFGRSLREVAPLLKDVAENTDQTGAEMARAAAEADEFLKSLSRLSFAIKEVSRSLAMPILEALNNYIERVRAATDANKGFFESFVKEGIFGETGVFRIGKLVEERARWQETLRRDTSDQQRAFAEKRIAELTKQIEEEKRRQFGEPVSAADIAAGKPSLGAAYLEAERQTEAAKQLEEARKKAADAAKKQAEAEEKLRQQLRESVADQQMLYELLKNGMELDEANLRIQLARKGATGEQIEQMAALAKSIDAIVEARKAQQKAEEELAKTQESLALIGLTSGEYERQMRFEMETLRVRGEMMLLTEKERQVEEAVIAIRQRNSQQLQDIEDKITEAIIKREFAIADALRTQKDIIAERGKVYETETRRIIEQQQQVQNSFAYGWNMAFRQYAEDAKNYARLGQQYFDTMANAMTTAIDRFVQTGKFSFRDFAGSVIKDLLRIQLQMQMMEIFRAATGWIRGLFGGGGGGGVQTTNTVGGTTTFFGRATGGWLDQPAIVGENGPELFIPQRRGMVIPNAQLSSFMQDRPQVVYNGPYIENMSTIDSRSFEDRIYQSANAVWTANQYANKGLAQPGGRS